MADRDERDQPEGVRILGAEEAQAVLGGDHGSRAPEPDDEIDEMLKHKEAELLEV